MTYTKGKSSAYAGSKKNAMTRRQQQQKFNSPNKYAHSFAFILLFIFIMTLLQLPFVFLYEAGIMQYSSLNFYSSAALSFSFSITAFVYLALIEKKGIKQSVDELGLSSRRLMLSMLGIGLVLFLVVFAFEGIVTTLEQVTHVTISTNVQNELEGAPLWFFVFAALIAPINEEILFRGLLVPRIGIIASAVIFAIPHYVYGSTYGIEVIAAFVFGLLAGYVYKKTKSLYPSVVAHMLVNIFAVVSLLA